MSFVAAAILIALPATAQAEKAPGALPEIGSATGALADAPDRREGDGIPDQLSGSQREEYRAIFAAIRGERWEEAKQRLEAMRPGPLHAIARAELYTAANSPRVELEPLQALLAEAPELPQAAQIGRLAALRGAMTQAALPVEQRLRWYDAAPVRQRLRGISTDPVATEVILAMQPFIREDDGAGAEQTLARFAADLSPEARTEWQQKVAWIYYTAGDDANARRMAREAQAGTGEFAAQADWVQGLAAWRQRDCRDAASAFDAVSRRASDPEMRSAGLYWLSRAHMACERPGDVTAALRGAAQYDETFYGLLARQALGIEEAGAAGEQYVTADWRALQERSNVRTAAALMEIGEAELAEEVLKHQARIGNAGEHGALTRLAGRLNLPSTQLWLSHNAPADAPPVEMARYPAPNWTPDGGWRVDRALVFAHTLQESRFRTEVRSAAGAMGLMQVREGAAIDVSRRRGVDYASADLTDPSINMEIGQSYLEQLRDTAFTQGLLPKVIAAYNAGPTPVQAWNSLTKDNGDPLLYIESIPYWETRGYVMIVLRNYWMYQRQDGRRSASRAALAQGLWPRFPGLPGQEGIRLSGGGGGQAVAGAR